MTLTVAQVLSDARRLGSRLRDHDANADGVISLARYIDFCNFPFCIELLHLLYNNVVEGVAFPSATFYVDAHVLVRCKLLVCNMMSQFRLES